METEDRNTQKVTLKLLQDISRTFVNLVSDMFGPSGKQTLLTTSTGKAVVTSDGFSVLSVLHLSHPVARFIVQNLQSYHLMTRDGTKTFTIYLAELLKHIECASDVHAAVCSKTCQPTCSMVLVSHRLKSFLQEDFSDILKLFTERLCVSQDNSRDYVETSMKNVLKTSLCTSLTPQLTHFFADVLWSMLVCEDENSKPPIIDQLSVVLENFDSYCVKAVGPPLLATRVFEGFLLQCNLDTQTLHFRENASCVRLVHVSLQHGSRKNSAMHADVVFAPSSRESVAESFLLKRFKAQTFMDSLKAANVNMVLSSETFPQHVLSLFKEQDISVIHNVDSGEMTLLQKWTGVSYAEFQGGSIDDSVITVNVHQILIGTTKFVLLTPCVTVREKTLPAVRQIVLCAPTAGWYDQIRLSLYKALKSLHACFLYSEAGSLELLHMAGMYPLNKLQTCAAVSADVVATTVQTSLKTFCVVGGGGTFEAVLSSAIEDYYKDSDRVLKNRTVGTLVKNMLAAVPRRLCTNLSPVNTPSGHHFLVKWTEMLVMARQSCPVGLSTNGDVLDAGSAGVLEPVACKVSTVICVIELVRQLLLLETVVSTNTCACRGKDCIW